MKPISDTSARFHAAYVETILRLKPRILERRLSAMERLTPEWLKSPEMLGRFRCATDITENSIP